MAPKKNAREPTPVAAATTQASTTAAGSVPLAPKPKATSTGAANWDEVLQNIYDYYMTETPQRTKLLDVFLVFLAAVGALQFLYCILAGNYVRTKGRRRRGKGYNG
jgi:oligosaccharyltransferase complex subunit epsilon